MSTTLEGKVVLITGAGKGSGRALAEAFSAAGAIVAANDISPVNVEAVVADINTHGGKAKAYVHDIAKKVDVQAMLNNIVDESGRIDILVNCAHVEPHTSLIEIDEWDLHRVFEVNSIGTLLVSQSAARIMRDQGGGVIVTAISAGRGVAFTASRGGIADAMTELARELAPFHVFVHTILAASGISIEKLSEAVLTICSTSSSEKSGEVIRLSA